MPTPSEVKAVVALLKSADFETPEEGARAVIAKLDELRRDKMRYVLAVQGLPTAYLYGDFENRQEAVNWAKRVALDVSGLSVGVLPLYNRDAVLARHQKMTDEIVKKSTQEPIKVKRAPKIATGARKKQAA